MLLDEPRDPVISSKEYTMTPGGPKLYMFELTYLAQFYYIIPVDTGSVLVSTADRVCRQTRIVFDNKVVDTVPVAVAISRLFPLSTHVLRSQSPL